MNATSYVCFGCKRHFPIKELRYDSKGNNLLCASCREAFARQQPGERRTVQLPKTPPVMPARPKEAPQHKAPAVPQRPKLRAELDEDIKLPSANPPVASSMRYRCYACNYVFVRSTKVEGVCPYCSKKGTIRSDRGGGYNPALDF